MKQSYLPGNIRERLRDLMKKRKMTQAELAKRIEIAESSLSRFISGTTNKLSDESVIRIAETLNVSTDFLLGTANEPDRKNYDIAELGLSTEAARNLYTGKVNSEVVNRLLTDPNFAEATYLISRYLNDELAGGIAAQNQLYSSVASLLGGNGRDIASMKTPVYQIDLTAIQRNFMTAVKTIKKNALSDAKAEAEKLQKNIFDRMLRELTKGGEVPLRSVTVNDIAETVAESVAGMDGVTEETQEQIKSLFIALAGGGSHEKN